MSEIKITGKKLYLRHSFPCAEGRRFRKEITQEDLDELTRLVKSGEEPDEKFLGHCFPLSYYPFMAFSPKKYPNDPWSEEAVRDFWRNEHGRKGDERINPCHTEEAIVERENIGEIKGGGVMVSVTFPGAHSSFPAINFYCLDLKKGDRVILHKKWIVEKA